MRHALILWCMAAIGAGADLGTKWWAFNPQGPIGNLEIPPGCRPMVLVADTLVFETHWNPGALFGLGANHPWARWVFIGISFVAMVGLTWWYVVEVWHKQWWMRLATGMVLSGVIGNLYDRIIFGRVRDFIHFMIDDGRVFDWPIFNVADSFLCVGVGLIVLESFINPPEKQGKEEAKQTATSADSA